MSRRKNRNNKKSHRTRVLSKAERARYREVRKNQGIGAAQDYRQSIAARKGLTPKNAAPTPYGSPGPQYNLNTAGGTIGAAQDALNNAYTQNLRSSTYTQQGQFGGTSQWTRDPVTGQMIHSTQLSAPNQQRVSAEQQYGLAGTQAASVPLGAAMYNMTQPMSFQGAPQAPGRRGYENLRNRVTNETYQRFARRYDPVFARQDEDFEQRMMQQGIPQGSERYNELRTQHENRQGDLRADAISRAVDQGRQETSQAYDIGSRARSNAIGEMMTLRNQPLKDYSNLMGAIPGIRMDQFQAQTPAQIQAPDVVGAASTFYGNNLNYNMGNRKLANDWRMAQLQAQTQLAMKPEPADPAAEFEMWKKRQQYQYDNDPRNATPLYPTVKGPSTAQQIGAAAIPVVGSIIGGLMK